jgi:hypothetical protein
MALNEDLFNELSREPISLYVLYRVYLNPDEVDLPHFMDYGPTCRKLMKKELVEMPTGKHIHGEKYQVTNLGKKFIQNFKEKITNLFKNISLAKKEDFFQEVYLRLENLSRIDSITEHWDMLTETLGLPKNETWFTRSKIDMYMKLLSTNMPSPRYIDVKIGITHQCPKCDSKTTSTVNLEYNLTEYNSVPDAIPLLCKKCSYEMSIDAYFSRVTHI